MRPNERTSQYLLGLYGTLGAIALSFLFYVVGVEVLKQPAGVVNIFMNGLTIVIPAISLYVAAIFILKRMKLELEQRMTTQQQQADERSDRTAHKAAEATLDRLGNGDPKGTKARQAIADTVKTVVPDSTADRVLEKLQGDEVQHDARTQNRKNGGTQPLGE